MKFWKRVDGQNKTTTVESYSHDFEIEGAIEITEEEFNKFLQSLPAPVPIPSRDPLVEIDILRDQVQKIATAAFVDISPTK